MLRQFGLDWDRKADGFKEQRAKDAGGAVKGASESAGAGEATADLQGEKGNHPNSVD